MNGPLLLWQSVSNKDISESTTFEIISKNFIKLFPNMKCLFLKKEPYKYKPSMVSFLAFLKISSLLSLLVHTLSMVPPTPEECSACQLMYPGTPYIRQEEKVSDGESD